MDRQKIESLLRDLFARQSLAVLATLVSHGPYTTLVGFASTRDLGHIFFATTRATRKYAAIKANPQISMLIDSRTNETSDFREAVAVTALGTAEEIEKDAHADTVKLYLSKHPHLEEFVLSPTCALIRVTVDKYIVVTRFQQVVTLDLAR